MEDKGEVLYELGPKFDFFYEMTMPTGKKMRSSFVSAIVTAIITIAFFLFKDSLFAEASSDIHNMLKVIGIILIVLLVFFGIIFIARVLMQSLEYKGIKYYFYKNCMVYENNFLNQTRKTIEYSNIREVEIRRTLTDRMLNYGVIIIYTNAEKAYGSSATVIYAIKDIEKHYNNIERIIHNGNTSVDANTILEDN